MEVYATGFNAHYQLCVSDEDPTNDITKFSKLYRSPNIAVRCVLWSSTVIEVNGTLAHHGFRHSGTDQVRIDGPSPSEIKAILGDTSGVLGAVTNDGSFYVFHDSVSQNPEFKKHDFSPESIVTQQNLLISHLAIASNDQLCICTRTTSHTPIHALHTFPSFHSLLSSSPPTSTHPLPSPLTTLLASATAFTALTATGDVLTFGSPLHPQVLARTPTPALPAEVPCLVDSLGGIRIRKIVCGGWLGAALSVDSDLYVWGSCMPGRSEQRIGALASMEDGEDVKLVDIKGGVDVVDVGIGDGHVVVLTAEGEVWVCGEGGEGQLGLGRRGFEEDWIRIENVWERSGRAVAVGAGGWGSWIIVDRNLEK